MYEQEINNISPQFFQFLKQYLDTHIFQVYFPLCTIIQNVNNFITFISKFALFNQILFLYNLCFNPSISLPQNVYSDESICIHFNKRS